MKETNRHANTTCFIPEKGKITSLFSKNIKNTSKKLKNIPCCRFAIPKYFGKIIQLNRGRINDYTKKKKLNSTMKITHNIYKKTSEKLRNYLRKKRTKNENKEINIEMSGKD